MRYRARVIDASRHISTRIVEAAGADEARAELTSQGLTAMSLAPASAWSLGSHPWGRRGSGDAASAPQRFPLLLFAQELLALLEAGLSVIEAMEALLEKEPQAGTRAVLERIARDLRAGHRLSSALQRQSAVFPTLFCGMVQAAERTSSLPDALQRYVDYRQRLDQVRSKVASAAVYPAILMVVGGGVTLFLLMYVVPQFALVYQGTGRALPLASQLLLGWGRYAGEHAAALITGVLVLAGGTAALFWHARRTGLLARAMLRLPWIGERLRLVELSRLYLTLGLLLEGGMAIGPALTLLQSVGSADTRTRLERLRRAVTEGSALSIALEREALTTPVVVRLLRVGEESGQLGAMLRRAALFYDGETARWIDRFTRAFEPALMAAIGIVVGLIVLLLYMPIFDLAGSFQ